MNLRELGEDALLRKILPGLPVNAAVQAKAGDDCAVVKVDSTERVLLLKTDCVVEGIHFNARARPAQVGWKALMRPLSDFAAMSGIPQFALITLLAPAATTVEWTLRMYRGLTKAAQAFDVAIVGGETSRIDGPLALSVCVAGFAEEGRWVSRRGGKVNDELFVTGSLGGSIRGKHLRFTPRIAESRWLTKHFAIHAMMDLSDGLGADLPRLARASGLAFVLDEAAVPRTRGYSVEAAISDGEDYELLFALAPQAARRLVPRWQRQFPKLRLTRIGRLVAGDAAHDQHLAGYVHFR